MDIGIALFIAFIIGRIGMELCVESVKEVADTEIPIETQRRIQECIAEVPGVIGIDCMRSRKAGNKIFLEPHVLAEGQTTMVQVQRMIDYATRRLSERIDEITDIAIYTIPQAEEPQETEVR